MSNRISYSVLDPILSPLIPVLYRLLRIPRRIPPEGIVLVGHLLAVVGALGLACAPRAWWGGLLAAVGIAGNHVSDMLDGTHARATKQCRNGGELLDHFIDPLSFAYWGIALAVSVGNLVLGLAAVIVIYATALLTSIKAKLIGRFTLARFGPTEMKVLYVAYGLTMAAMMAWYGAAGALLLAKVFLWTMLTVGVIQLAWNLALAVGEVNRYGTAPDTTPWKIGLEKRRDHRPRIARPVRTAALVGALVVFAGAAPACASAMALQQPGRRDMGVLQPGTPREVVICELGVPTTQRRDGRYVDHFRFRQGFDEGVKWARAVGHAAADVTTYMLWSFAGMVIEERWSGEPVSIKVYYDAADNVERVEIIEGEKVIAKTLERE
ncbi:MAG: hypothetical protein CMJ18_28160 [Phycisphaeraceae bacterium]|nr:hypothetical protein [Phycisphaeraceae bacterium]